MKSRHTGNVARFARNVPNPEASGTVHAEILLPYGQMSRGGDVVIEVRGEKVKLPDFFLIGAAKSGTTSLYHYLIQHPQIYLPREKEPFFFSFMERPPHWRDSDLKGSRGKNVVWRLKDYVKLFQNAKAGQIIGEASTSYLYTYDCTIEHMISIYGERYRDIKIMAILRNPIERAYSHYLYLTKMGWEALPFEDAIRQSVVEERIAQFKDYDYIGQGMYYARIQSYLKEFSNVRIYLYDDLKDPVHMLKNMFDFLGVNPQVTIRTQFVVNPSGIPKTRFVVDVLFKFNRIIRRIIPQRYSLRCITIRDSILRTLLEKPQIDDVTRSHLIQVYREDVLKLQELINRDLSHWLEVT